MTPKKRPEDPARQPAKPAESTRAEQAARADAGLIDRIFESSALSTWISDEHGTLIRANPACLAFFGATEEEVVGKYNLFQDEVIREQGPRRSRELLGDLAEKTSPALLDDLLSRFRDAHGGALRIRDIARTLGTFSRVEDDRPGPVDLRQVIEAAADMATNEVRSRPGKGTVFTVRLPAGAVTAEPAAAAPRPAEEPSLRGRILIVDDEASIRGTMARMLRAHETVQAVNGTEAQKIIEADSGFDLILCDMMMPGISGMDLHAWLASAHPRLARQFVFMTGGAFTPRAREYLNKVGNVRLEKPFNTATLKMTVGELLRGAKRR